MLNNLDLKDRKILYQLDIDCRQSNSQIGKKTGISKQVVDYRIKQLVKEGIITRFATAIDTYKLGFSKFKIYLSLENADNEIIKKIIEFLKKHKKTEWVATCSGKWDIIAGYFIKDVYEFSEAIKELDEKFRDVYSRFYIKLPELITPELFDQAINHIMLTREDYEKIKPATSGAIYNILEVMKQQTEDNTIENKIKNELGKKCDIDKIKYWINNDYYGKNYSNHLLKLLIDDISCLSQVVEEFENELNPEDFERKYKPVKSKILDIKRKGECMHESINNSLDKLEQKLIQEYHVK